MDKLARLPLRRHKVIPATRDVRLGVEPQDALADGIAMMVVVEEPAFVAGPARGYLNRLQVHRGNDTRKPAPRSFECLGKPEPGVEALQSPLLLLHDEEDPPIDESERPVPIPVLKPTVARNETFAGVTYHIEGEMVPVLHLELASVPVYF